MATIMKRFTKGVVLKGETADVTENAEGSLFQNSSELRLKAYIEGAVRQVVTNTQSQVLTNKTIDLDNNNVSNIQTSNLKSGVLNTSTTLASASDTQLPSALAVKTYVDNVAAAQNEASEIGVSPAVNGQTTVQAALENHETRIDTAEAHIAASTNVHGLAVGSAVVGTTDSQSLSNKTLTGASIQVPIRSDVKQDTLANLVTYALTATNGQLAFATDTKEMFQVVDGLLESVGGGEGIGGVDILFTQTFEEAALSDFTETGLDLSQTDPLHGEISALLTHDSVSNQSFKQVIPVDRKFRGESMTMRLNVKSDASDGNVTLNVYDETNAANLIASEQLQLSNDVSGQLNKFGFTIPETCASLSYTITALPEAGSPETRIDDIIAELAVTSLLSTSVEVPNITAWQGYTPTFQGFGTPSAVEFEWRQVGEDVEIRGKFVSGTVTSIEARVGLPAGLTSAGTNLIPSLQNIGELEVSFVGASSYSVLIEPSVSYLTFGRQSGTSSGLTKANASADFSTGATYSFFAKVPCAGLSATTTKSIDLTQSGLVQEGDSVLRLRTFNAYASTATRIPRFSNVDQNLGSSLQYNSSATDGDSITVLENGTYTFNFSFSANSTHSIALSRNPSVGERATNASSLTGAVILNRQSGIPGNQSTTVSWSGELNSGDVIYPHTDAVVSSGGNEVRAFFSASKQGSLKQVSVSSDQKIKIPTSELRMEGASSRGAVATAIVRFDTVAKIRGDAFTVTSTANDGTFVTMRKAGRLSISACLGANASPSNIVLTKNLSNLTVIPSVAAEILASEIGTASSSTNISWTGDVALGDVIRVATGNNPTAAANNMLTLAFQEQEISVSVTNTLPQFSESDSSVRLNVANGFGSTATSTMRFATLIENLGSDIEYVDSASNGATFTAKSAGLYSISATVQGSGGVTSFGITRNAVGNESVATLGTAGSALLLDWTSESDGAFNNVEQIGGQYRLGQGDVIRLQSNSAPITNGNIRFSISKVGKPNVTGVDVTPFVNVPQPVSQSRLFTMTTLATNTNLSGGTVARSNGSGLFSLGTTGIRFLKPCNIYVTLNGVHTSSTNAQGEIFLNGAVAGEQTSKSSSSTTNNYSVAVNIEVNVDDLITFAGTSTTFNQISIIATALSDSILTAPETFSTDTASLTYAPSSVYTLSTLANAPVGTFITFTYAANTNTRTQTTTAPTQTTADMNTNGILIYTRAYNAASTAAQPAAIAIQIGKGLKGKSLDLYKSVGKITSGNLDTSYYGTAARYGAQGKDYDEKTGVLYIDAALNAATVTSAEFWYSDTTLTTSGYLVINASKNPVITGFGLNRIAARGENTAGTSFSTEAIVTYNATKTLDTNGALNNATGVFTAPETGYYQVSASFLFASAAYTAGQTVVLSGYKNGVRYGLVQNVAQATVSVGLGVTYSDVVFLGKNDTFDMRLTNNRGATALSTGAGANYFSIVKTSV